MDLRWKQGAHLASSVEFFGQVGAASAYQNFFCGMGGCLFHRVFLGKSLALADSLWKVRRRKADLSDLEYGEKAHRQTLA
ncbi:MAG: hypothetical protein N2253_06970 [Bacteroidia bacterium]|nr:hypothetical protein [Bacteroidia bacterium]MCX7764614.1 hypothetical protein [Bacteroidia bacterium]